MAISRRRTSSTAKRRSSSALKRHAAKTYTAKKAQANPYTKVCKNLEKKISKSYKKLNTDLKKHASLETIQKDNHELILLFGEFNYLTREWQQMERKAKWKR